MEGDVPETLRGITGAKYRGEFEERMKAVLDECKTANGRMPRHVKNILKPLGKRSMNEEDDNNE